MKMKRITEQEFNELDRNNPFGVTETALIENFEYVCNNGTFVSTIDGISYFWNYRQRGSNCNPVVQPFEGNNIIADYDIGIGRDRGERNAENRKVLTYEVESYYAKINTELTNDNELVKKIQNIYMAWEN